VNVYEVKSRGGLGEDMRRLLAASALTGVLLTAMAAPAPAASSVVADTEVVAGVSAKASSARTEEAVTAGEQPTTVPSEEPEGGDPPARFDSLWLLIVGALGLLLLIGIVRTQRRWDSSSKAGEQSRNESGVRDVLEEE
jgi:hypothetical protein